MENTIEIKDLSFSFNKGKPILKDLNINVPKGSIFGFWVQMVLVNQQP
nr:hypothetical protein [Elizabethkingia bruuniana]